MNVQKIKRSMGSGSGFGLESGSGSGGGGGCEAPPWLTCDMAPVPYSGTITWVTPLVYAGDGSPPPIPGELVQDANNDHLPGSSPVGYYSPEPGQFNIIPNPDGTVPTNGAFVAFQEPVYTTDSGGHKKITSYWNYFGTASMTGRYGVLEGICKCPQGANP